MLELFYEEDCILVYRLAYFMALPCLKTVNDKFVKLALIRKALEHIDNIHEDFEGAIGKSIWDVE